MKTFIILVVVMSAFMGYGVGKNGLPFVPRVDIQNIENKSKELNQCYQVVAKCEDSNYILQHIVEKNRAERGHNIVNQQKDGFK